MNIYSNYFSFHFFSIYIDLFSFFFFWSLLLLLFPINSAHICLLGFFFFLHVFKIEFHLLWIIKPTAREKILLGIFSRLLLPIFLVHKYICVRSLFSLLPKDTVFSLGRMYTNKKHYSSSHVCHCSGYNCNSTSSYFIVFLFLLNSSLVLYV